jgi:hypothetical protein
MLGTTKSASLAKAGETPKIITANNANNDIGEKNFLIISLSF